MIDRKLVNNENNRKKKRRFIKLTVLKAVTYSRCVKN